ncbi:MAG: hypothetical protein ACRC6K_02975 [Fusobacteriaceae bacterium]
MTIEEKLLQIKNLNLKGNTAKASMELEILKTDYNILKLIFTNFSGSTPYSKDELDMDIDDFKQLLKKEASCGVISNFEMKAKEMSLTTAKAFDNKITLLKNLLK